MFDAKGKLVWAADHHVWGAIRSVRTSGALALKPLHDPLPAEHHCPFRFPGQYEDAETGLYYNRHRHYDPLTGQYASPDPIGLQGGDRPQGYVTNPAVWTDPLGLSKVVELSPYDIRFSQSSVTGAGEITKSMRASGWKGDPIDVVKMPDGKLTTIDNTRVVAAGRANIMVKARVRSANDPLTPDEVRRFTRTRGNKTIVPSTWGEAINARIWGQSRGFSTQYPNGSPFTGAID
jgi:RHS repeat-associated protein